MFGVTRTYVYYDPEFTEYGEGYKNLFNNDSDIILRTENRNMSDFASNTVSNADAPINLKIIITSLSILL